MLTTFSIEPRGAELLTGTTLSEGCRFSRLTRFQSFFTKFNRIGFIILFYQSVALTAIDNLLTPLSEVKLKINVACCAESNEMIAVLECATVSCV